MSIPAQVKYIVISIMFVLASINFTRTAVDVLQNSKRLESLQAEVIELEEKESELKATIEFKKSADFIEERARNALNMIKPNEKVFVIPTVLAATEEDVSYKESTHKKSNFQLWMDLLF